MLHLSIATEPELSSLDEWASVLKVAHHWDFGAIVELAFEKIEPLASPVDKILFGKDYNMREWIAEGRIELCRRERPIILEEAFRLGMAEVVNISTTRESIRSSEVPPEIDDSDIHHLLNRDRALKGSSRHEILQKFLDLGNCLYLLEKLYWLNHCVQFIYR